MAQTAVDIVVKVVGDQKLKQLDASLKGTAANAVKADNKLDGFSNAADKAGKSSAKASSNVSKLSAGLGKLAVALGAAEAARRAFSIGLESIGSSTRLAALTSQYGEFESAQRRVLAIQEKFNLTQIEATQQFSTAYARLKPLGFTLDEITDAYEGISTATKTAALDAGAANALFTQTAQALGSGVVQAEELNTIIDQAPTIVVALADELGVAAGEVKKLASDGKVSSQALLNALVKVKEEGVDLLATSLDTPGEKIKFFQRVTEQVVNALVTGVIADLTEAIKDIGLAIQDLTPVFQGLGTIAQVVMRPIIGLFRLGAEVAAGFGRVVANIAEGNWKALIEPDTKALTNVKEIIDDIFAPLDGNLPSIPQGNLPSPTRTPRLPGGTSGGSSGIGTGSEFAQFLKDQEKQLANSQKLLGDAEAANQLAKAKTEIERINIQFAKDVSDVLLKNQELVKKSKSDEETKNLLKLRSLELDTLALEKQKEIDQLREDAVSGINDEIALLEAKLAGKEEEYKLAKKIAELEAGGLSKGEATQKATRAQQLQEEVAQVEALKQQYQQLASGIAGEMTGAFRSIIDGTKSVDEAFADMLKGIADKFLDMAMKILTDALTQQLMNLFSSLLSGGNRGFGATPMTSGMDFFADGGRPEVGKVSLVGERGPELFVPDSPGTVVSNEQSRAQLDMYSPGNAVDAPTGPMNVNMSYSGPTMAFDDKRYLPVEAVPAIIKDAAKQGEQRALSSMRNRVSTRNRVGI